MGHARQKGTLWRALGTAPVLLALVLALGGAPGAQAASFDWAFGFAGPDMETFVYAFVVFDDGTGPALYAGGDFRTAGGAIFYYIAKWTGTSWAALGSGMNNTVRGLTVFDDGNGLAL